MWEYKLPPPQYILLENEEKMDNANIKLAVESPNFVKLDGSTLKTLRPLEAGDDGATILVSLSEPYGMTAIYKITFKVEAAEKKVVDEVQKKAAEDEKAIVPEETVVQEQEKQEELKPINPDIDQVKLQAVEAQQKKLNVELEKTTSWDGFKKLMDS